MYDGVNQLFIENPLERYLLNANVIGQFKMEEDSSLVLHIAKESPGGDRESNWLPAPDGPFYMVLRLYGPEPAALEGKWTPPFAEGWIAIELRNQIMNFKKHLRTLTAVPARGRTECEMT